jgi:hypothetical protein
VCVSDAGLNSHARQVLQDAVGRLLLSGTDIVPEQRSS